MRRRVAPVEATIAAAPVPAATAAGGAIAVAMPRKINICDAARHTVAADTRLPSTLRIGLVYPVPISSIADGDLHRATDVESPVTHHTSGAASTMRVLSASSAANTDCLDAGQVAVRKRKGTAFAEDKIRILWQIWYGNFGQAPQRRNVCDSWGRILSLGGGVVPIDVAMG